jgi:hypothetical protein
VLRQHQKERQSADSTDLRRQYPEPQKADNAAQQLKLSTDLKRAKRESNGHWVCADFVS